jgi:DNA primase
MRLEDLVAEDYKLSGSGRYIRTMEHDSLVIDTKEQVFYWNSRNIYGTAIDWLTKVKDIPYKQAKEMIGDELPLTSIISSHDIQEKDKVGNHIPFKPLVNNFFEKGKNNRDYWYGRGYTDETINRFELGYDGKEWYTIPIYVDGKFVNFQLRKNNPKRMKHWYRGVGPHPFNFSILKMNDWVVLTEGPVDAIMLTQYGIPAVSHTGAAGYWNNSWITYFNGIREIYCTYDNDKAGWNGSIKVSYGLGVGRVKIYNMWNFDEKYDVSDYFNDGGSAEEFVQLLKDNYKFAYQMKERK